LNPVGAKTSQAHAVFGSQQVGYAEFQRQHAGLWNGTADSWVDLNPAGATVSQARGTTGAYQVGFAHIGDWYHAGIWSGSAQSWEDLSLALTGFWGDTYAQSVWDDGTTLFIAGYGRNYATNRTEAILWTRPIPASGATGAFLLATGLLLMQRERR
jgi:hypothetical protein